MRTKLSVFAFILVLALALSACASAAAQPRTLAVTGSGTVYLTPDIAYIYIGVHTEDPNLASAVSNNNTQAQALVDALKNAGIAAKDIQTSNFSVYSNNNPSIDKTTGQPITGGYYAVDNTVYVTLRDLSHMGKILNTAVSSGANNINSITFDVADKTAAQQQARQKAMANAGSLAAELAKTAGLKLGDIQNVSYSDTSVPYYGYGMGGGGSSAPNASVPIQPGQTQVSVSVSVTYALK
ncbi:MAG TPA: SIMPL domain-containing protein [Anaerolineales bacterium]|nr:SIMPL domain-containing protein [Anaerolineales bacterium]